MELHFATSAIKTPTIMDIKRAGSNSQDKRRYG